MKLSRIEITTVFTLLCMNDRILPFNSRNEIIHRTKIYIEIITKFKLTIYTSRGSKWLKTKAILSYL